MTSKKEIRKNIHTDYIVRKGDKYIIQLIYIYTYIYKQNIKQYNTRLFNHKIKQNVVIDGNI